MHACQVILLTDADVDGAHIRTLLLTFLFRYARDLFDKGHVYVGVPPLYKLEAKGRKAEYLYDDAQLAGKTAGLTAGSFSIQRFKVPCSDAAFRAVRDEVFACMQCMHSILFHRTW